MTITAGNCFLSNVRAELSRSGAINMQEQSVRQLANVYPGTYPYQMSQFIGHAGNTVSMTVGQNPFDSQAHGFNGSGTVWGAMSPSSIIDGGLYNISALYSYGPGNFLTVILDGV